MDQAWKQQLMIELTSIKARLKALEVANACECQRVFSLPEVNTFRLEDTIEAADARLLSSLTQEFCHEDVNL